MEAKCTYVCIYIHTEWAQCVDLAIFYSPYLKSKKGEEKKKKKKTGNEDWRQLAEGKDMRINYWVYPDCNRF